MPIKLNINSKILIVRLSSIGDIILCSPVIRAVSEQIGCEIHFLTKPPNTDLVIHNPHITKVHLYEDYDRLKKELRQEKFDLIIDLHKNLRTTRIKTWIGCHTISFHKANIEKWLMVNFKWNYLPKMHLVDRYFESLKEIGVTNDFKGLDMYYPSDLNFEVDVSNFIVLVIGTAHFTKTMPIQLCKRIVENIDGQFILLGGKQEVEKSKLLEPFENVTNLVGKTSLLESAKVIKESQLVISGDTGMMHMAAALKIPIVSVWGSTFEGFGMTPYYGNIEIEHREVEVENLSCRPCTKIGRSGCPMKHFNCMNKISTEVLISNINDLIIGN